MEQICRPRDEGCELGSCGVTFASCERLGGTNGPMMDDYVIHVRMVSHPILILKHFERLLMIRVQQWFDTNA